MDSVSPKKLRKCKICDRNFRSTLHLVKHGFQFHDFCHLCDLQFESREDAEIHIETEHSDVSYLKLSRFSCQDCDQSFQSVALLEHHKKVRSIDLGPLKCFYCPFKHCLPIGVTYHMKKIHNYNRFFCYYLHGRS